MRTPKRESAYPDTRNCVPGNEGVGGESQAGYGLPAIKGPEDLHLPLETLSSGSPLIKAEVNLLRLPVFALSTKGLKNINGLEVRGVFRRGGEEHEYVFQTGRNVMTLYPGPLARSAHLALLSMGTERLPVPHPLTWTWRELCRRIGCNGSGSMIAKLKEAMAATAGLTIRSRSAIWSKPQGRYLTETDQVLHLYDRLVFHGHRLPSGETADHNHLWLADWYRENLDALYAAPLDHDLWRWLDERSPIASRAYEFLLVNFYATPLVRINYPTLAGFLPIKVERYYSDAQRQLEGALTLLVQTSLIHTVTWTKAKGGAPQLLLERGSRLDRAKTLPVPTTAVCVPETEPADDKFRAHWLPVWETLEESERSDIRQRTRAKYPFLRLISDSGTLDALCLEQLAKERENQG
jgi:hypothetical protein